MAEPIILDANITPLKKQLRDATQELQVARQKFGDLSTEAVNAAKKVALIRDSIEDANESSQLFDPGKRFQALTTAASTAAGAIGAVQGAMALFGNESEDVQKALLKVQSAMALSQGLSQLKDIGKVGDQLTASFKGLTAGANGFKKALISTGIGALVVAVGLLVTYWEDILGLVSGVDSEQKKLNEDTQKGLEANEQKLEAIDGQTNQLKLQGKSEKDILMLKQEQTKEAIQSAEINLLNAKATKDAQVQASIRNKAILEGLIRIVTVPIQAVLASIDLIGKAAGQEFNLMDKFTGGLAEMVFDPNEVAEKGDATIKEAENKLNQLKEKQAGFQLSIEGLDKAAAEKGAAEREKQNTKTLEAEKILSDARIKALDKQKQEELAVEAAYAEKFLKLKEAGVKDDGSLADAQDKELKVIRDKYQKEQLEEEAAFQKIINDLRTQSRLEGIEEENTKAREALLLEQEKRRNELLAGVKDNAERKKILEMELAQTEKQEMDALNKSFAEAKLISDLAELDAEAAKITTTYERQREIVAEQERINLELYGKTEKERTAILEASTEQRKAIDMAELTAKTEMQNKYFDLAAQFGNVMQQFAGKNKKLAIAGVIVEQSAAIGTIISNTAAANAKATLASPLTGGLPFTAINTISAGLSIASTIRGAVKAIQGINSGTSVSNGGIQAPTGISASAPSTSGSVPTIGNSPVTALGTMMSNQPPLKAYVVESEVTSTQKRVADIERRAGF